MWSPFPPTVGPPPHFLSIFAWCGSTECSCSSVSMNAVVSLRLRPLQPSTSMLSLTALNVVCNRPVSGQTAYTQHVIVFQTYSFCRVITIIMMSTFHYSYIQLLLLNSTAPSSTSSYADSSGTHPPQFTAWISLPHPLTYCLHPCLHAVCSPICVNKPDWAFTWFSAPHFGIWKDIW